MYERFTDRARWIMQLANREAQRLGSEHIGAEHILLGLIMEGGGVAAYVLRNLHVDLHKLRFAVEKAAHLGHEQSATDARSPQRSRGKKVIEHAIEESQKFGHDYVGTEHILLGLLSDASGIAAAVLSADGVTLERAREEIAGALAGGARSRPPPPKPREIEDLPAELATIATEFDAEIDRITMAKEKAIASQDFETAASLRDQAHAWRLKRRRLLHGWIADRWAESGWLPQLHTATIELAQAIGDRRNWAALPQLAEALEEAGCTDAELISHCRQAGKHSSHCWVIDLLLAGE